MFHSCPCYRLLKTPAGWFTAILILSGMTGCHGWHKAHLSAVQSFRHGEIAESRLHLEASRQRRGAETDLLTLEQSVVDLASGQPQSAERSLREVRRELEYLKQKDLGEQTSAVLSDDRAVAYAGRDYERTMVLNLLMLSSLLGNGQDSFAYATQCHQLCHEQRDVMLAHTAPPSGTLPLGDGPESVQPVGFTQISPQGATPTTALHPTTGLHPAPQPQPTAEQQPLALASYLAAAAFSENIHHFQQTEQALAEVATWNPDFARQQARLQPGGMGTQTPAGFGCVHVFVFVGHAPEWVAETAAPTSAALLIADRILTATGKHTLPPTIAPVQIGRPVADPTTPRPGFLTGSVSQSNSHEQRDELPLTFLSLLNLNDAAEASYHQNRDQEIARAITRRVVKKGAVYVLKETQHIHRNSLIDLGVNVAGVLWEALERPDLRSWRLLPARIDVARAECPQGNVRLNLRIAGQISTMDVTVPVENGRNTYVALFVPHRRFAGHMIIGGPEYRTLELTPAKAP